MALSWRILLRRLWWNRGFSITAIVVLGFGLGLNLTLFHATYALLWRPLALPSPERLVTLAERRKESGQVSRSTITGAQAEMLRQQAPSFSAVGLVRSDSRMLLLAGNEPLDLGRVSVDSGYFRALGIAPLLGGFFSEADDRGQAGELHAVLTEEAWRSYFHSDASVVGKIYPYRAGAEEKRVRIVGVVPEKAMRPFAARAEIFVALATKAPEIIGNSGDAMYQPLLRMSRSSASDQALTEVHRALMQTTYKGSSAYLVLPLREALKPVKAKTLVLLACASALLLLVTCANVSCLFLARVVRETNASAVKLALGARKRELVRAYLCESTVLCAAGVCLAFALQYFARPLVSWILPDFASLGPESLTLGPFLLLSSLSVCLIAIFCVALPAVCQTLRLDLRTALTQASRNTVSGSGRWPAVLLGLQTALVVVLLSLGSWITQSFAETMQYDSGFQSKGVVTFRVSLPQQQQRLTAAAADLSKLLQQIPGTHEVAFAADPPLGESMATTMNTRPKGFSAGDPVISFRMVGSGYFSTLGAQLLRGRDFSESEIQAAAPVILLNQSAAKILFPGQEPMGKTVHMGFLGLHSSVIGVVKDIRHDGLDQPAGAVAYLPYVPVFPGSISILARTEASPQLFASEVKARMRRWNADAYPRKLDSLAALTRETIHERYVSCTFVAGFALVGLLLSSLGLYGALSSEVHRRRAEVGIRISFGADIVSIVRLVFTRGARIVLPGAALGGTAALALRRLLISLYGVQHPDSAALLPSALLLVLACALSCMVPAIRAARVNPAEMLRNS